MNGHNGSKGPTSTLNGPAASRPPEQQHWWDYA